MKTPDNVLQNCKMPQGKLGEETLSRMNESHAELTAWAFSQIDMKDDAIVLDVGCGGGNALKMLSRRAKNGKLYGIDYSETSVEVAAKENKEEEQKRIVDVLGMHNNTPKELEQMLTGAGYSNVRIELDEGRGWLCAFAQK